MYDTALVLARPRSSSEYTMSMIGSHLVKQVKASVIEHHCSITSSACTVQCHHYGAMQQEVGHLSPIKAVLQAEM